MCEKRRMFVELDESVSGNVSFGDDPKGISRVSVEEGTVFTLNCVMVLELLCTSCASLVSFNKNYAYKNKVNGLKKL
ncbi:hypothetical protein MTR_7g101210 [Medicago truncatula]|uniref:Uncharacterized protein n=1 Tax=Medicago truncatula TaxID=3880 RepID=Q2HV47_MEDTR|nr:hypothetical protein MtrDRAFT_AC148995g18v2 [Medicago truncatula]AES81847.1 hypothetical protein MTR_7g101210 [Medicago truncatula]